MKSLMKKKEKNLFMQSLYNASALSELLSRSRET